MFAVFFLCLFQFSISNLIAQKLIIRYLLFLTHLLYAKFCEVLIAFLTIFAYRQTRIESVYYATNILIITYEFFRPLGNENMRRVLIYAN